MTRFSGAVAVVTGAAGDIGRQTAIRFAEEGARVAVTDRSDDLLARGGGPVRVRQRVARAMGEGAGTVIVGGGQAGFHAARALRARGYERPIRLVCEEKWCPYQRPPLSKQFLYDGSSADSLRFADPTEFADQHIVWAPGRRASAIDPAGRRVHLAGGESVDYEHLILATGARNRRLTGHDVPAGVHDIRSIDDALTIRERLQATDRIVIVGAGFIGLEVASVATDLGLTAIWSRTPACMVQNHGTWS